MVDVVANFAEVATFAESSPFLGFPGRPQPLTVANSDDRITSAQYHSITSQSADQMRFVSSNIRGCDRRKPYRGFASDLLGRFVRIRPNLFNETVTDEDELQAISLVEFALEYSPGK